MHAFGTWVENLVLSCLVTQKLQMDCALFCKAYSYSYPLAFAHVFVPVLICLPWRPLASQALETVSVRFAVSGCLGEKHTEPLPSELGILPWLLGALLNELGQP